MGEADDWRADVLHAMLRIAAWLVPVVGVIAIVFRPPPHLDAAGQVVVACTAIFVGLGAMGRRLPYGVRAWGALLGLYLSATAALHTSGFSPGAAACAMDGVVFAAIFLGRRAMLSVLGVFTATYLTMGLLVESGMPLERASDLDPHEFRNWLRSGVVLGGLCYLVGTAVWFVIRQVEAGRERAAKAADKLRIAYMQLVRLHRRLESTKDDERRHLSRELHDELGQSLTALKLRLKTLARGAAPESAAPFEDSIALVDDLVQRVRALAVNLRPPLLDELGLEAALRALVEEQARLAGIVIALEANGLQDRLTPEVEMTCFRVVQEAVTNVVRHAGASGVTVRVARSADQVELRILDDGCGMAAHDVEMFGRVGHLGLVGMRERARALGGQIRLSSPPEAQATGTLVEVTLPTHPAQPAQPAPPAEPAPITKPGRRLGVIPRPPPGQP